MKNYYLFLDESGHHGLKTINQEYPILLLCGCLVEQNYYSRVQHNFNELKQKYFGNTKIIFHSRDIRKWQNDFLVLGDLKLRHKFYQDLDEIVRNLDFRIIAVAVLKNELINY